MRRLFKYVILVFLFLIASLQVSSTSAKVSETFYLGDLIPIVSKKDDQFFFHGIKGIINENTAVIIIGHEGMNIELNVTKGATFRIKDTEFTVLDFDSESITLEYETPPTPSLGPPTTTPSMTATPTPTPVDYALL